MPINLRAPEVKELKPRITVLGCGGAGGNAVNNMVNAKLEGVSFVVANTDAQALAQSKASCKIQLGARLTEGLGAGAKPEVGRGAAEESLDEVLEQLSGSHMVFITAGMGGGTGTGAAPVIARAVRELGILTVGVVTKPFQFEGDRRMKLAERGIEELQNFVDTLIVIPNQNLFRVANERTTFAQAFAMADDVLHCGVRGITDLIVMPGLINRDFADIRTVMSEMGKAMMGTGEMDGDGRALRAAEAAISNPLLDDVSMKGARAVLINVTGGPDLMLFEVDEAVNRIRAEVDPDANILFGSAMNEGMEGRVRVSVVATGIESEAFAQQPPANVAMLRPLRPRSLEAETPAAAPAAPVAPPAAASPVHKQMEALAQTLAQQAAPEAPTPSEMSGADEPLDLGGEEAPALETPQAQALRMEARPGYVAPEPEKRRGFGLFGRGKREAKPQQRMMDMDAPRSAPAPRPAQTVQPAPTPRVVPPAAPSQNDDLFAGVSEDDRFEIPAFLRRQAN